MVLNLGLGSKDLAGVTVTIPTWRRGEQLEKALRRILICKPPPGEVLVHVDAGDYETPQMLQTNFSGKVDWIQSSTLQGPGGGRNLLIDRAQYPLVACFDDDSWPSNDDYFQAAEEVLLSNPRVAVLAAKVTLPGQSGQEAEGTVSEISCYENCACVLRQKAVVATARYLPLRYAYGMEEADVSLQLLDAGWSILRVPFLQVYHDTGMEHHASADVNAAHITNAALLAFLRYPVRYWPLGVAQVLNRAQYSIRMRRYRGLLRGLAAILPACRRHAYARRAVSAVTIARSRRLARYPVQVSRAILQPPRSAISDS